MILKKNINFAEDMTLDILICTIDEGIKNVPEVLMSPREDVSYVVSMQFTDKEYLKLIPEILREREDVVLTTLEGRGLSRNRNNAIDHSSADILLIADDDVRYTKDGIDNIFKAYDQHKDADIICFKAETLEGMEMKNYPAEDIPFTEAFKRGYYPSSIEVTFRRNIPTRFDERFGLGSEKLCSGEEDVFIYDAMQEGAKVWFVPETIVRTADGTTGDFFLTNKKVQLSKGATFRHIFGMKEALWRSVKEGGWYFIHKGKNPLPIILNMWKGILDPL